MRNAVLIMCAFFCMQCTSKRVAGVDDTIEYDFELQEQMSFEDVAYPDLLGATMQLVKKGDYLFINEFHGDSLIHVFNLRTAQKERCLVASGNGPDELISPLELQMVDDNLWILSRPLHFVNKNDKFHRQSRNLIHQLGEFHQRFLGHFDHAQPLSIIGIENRLHRRGFPGAPVPIQQAVIGR